jgi:hypothetical protein
MALLMLGRERTEPEAMAAGLERFAVGRQAAEGKTSPRNQLGLALQRDRVWRVLSRAGGGAIAPNLQPDAGSGVVEKAGRVAETKRAFVAVRGYLSAILAHRLVVAIVGVFVAHVLERRRR